ncbi:unnamed protein product [Mytilus edulis]|uniref:Uncharacterized protein n=1 Tax=Mytilus edulis TaxID=6550 RepID=A0A8S3SV04_MYTED|nr:unnamed protein product [Mytilus edulis]
MKEKIDNLEEDKCMLNDKLIDMQCRSMKYNLIFSGIEEHRDEDCEDKLRRFIYQDMRIEHRLEFGNVHRFGKSYRNKPRPIIARFLYFSDLDMVKRAGKNLKGTHYGVNQQFPAEIEEKRRKLYPIMKAERKNNSKVVLIRDKLYVNDELVTVSNDEAPREEPRQTPIRPKKRSRVSSTPDRDGHKSKTDDLDEIDIPNFEIKMKNRFTLRRVKSGGIVLCFRTHLADKINMIDTDSKYIMWFTVDKEIFRLNQNVLFGIVYIPPENSSYCIGDPYHGCHGDKSYPRPRSELNPVGVVLSSNIHCTSQRSPHILKKSISPIKTSTPIYIRRNLFTQNHEIFETKRADIQNLLFTNIDVSQYNLEEDHKEEHVLDNEEDIEEDTEEDHEKDHMEDIEEEQKFFKVL